MAPRSKQPDQAPEQSSTQDRVDLSTNARDVRQMAKVLADTPDVREAKVAELKRAVEGGTYHVNAGQIAEKMLEDALLDLRI